jgi:DNA-binding PucR family transcriptional regulator
VRIFLEEQHDRRRTARRLALHPNTVDNRLARVAELTGLDPSTPRGVTLLVTALALRDLG